jgi:hypothetical protein
MKHDSREHETEAKGLNAPRIKRADLEAEIADDMFLCGIDGRLTICVLRLKNGYLVTGESAATHADNYDQARGKLVARANAVEKLWSLLGFRLRDQLSMPAVTVNEREATHYCTECGALWWDQQTAWSLVSRHCDKCCDNAPMGDQIKPLPRPGAPA